MANAELPKFSIVPLLTALKHTGKFIIRHRRIFIGLVAIGILIGAYFPIRMVYKDHYPSSNLSSGRIYTLSSSNGYTSTENFRAPNNWSIAYNISCNTPSDGFTVQVIDTNGTIDTRDNGTLVTDSNGNPTNLVGSGTAIQPSKGVYSISILNYGCTYHIVVSASPPLTLPPINLKANQYTHSPFGYTTSAFTVTNSHWGYNWSYNDCTGTGVIGMGIFVLDPNGKPDDTNLGILAFQIPNTSSYPKASGTEQENQAGTYKLFVGGNNCAVHVQVLNNVGATTSTIPKNLLN